jgi:hypothetical protein
MVSSALFFLMQHHQTAGKLLTADSYKQHLMQQE